MLHHHCILAASFGVTRRPVPIALIECNTADPGASRSSVQSPGREAKTERRHRNRAKSLMLEVDRTQTTCPFGRGTKWTHPREENMSRTVNCLRRVERGLGHSFRSLDYQLNVLLASPASSSLPVPVENLIMVQNWRQNNPVKGGSAI